jgi:hypothetical protein
MARFCVKTRREESRNFVGQRAEIVGSCVDWYRELPPPINDWTWWASQH